MISIEGIRATGMYLLEVLKHEKVVPYSRFYNRIPETDETLAKGAMPFMTDGEEDAEDELREEGHVMLDFAAWQLEDLGIVRITMLNSRLIDGQPDFQIELTEKGQEIVRDGLRYGFRSVEYSIQATSASEWLITLLAAGDGASLRLRQVMEYGHSDGEVVIIDDCGNEYGLGTGTYAWAFEVALWHHARRNAVVPVPNSVKETKVWLDFVSRNDRPSCPSIFDPHPVWDVPFRLADPVVQGKLDINHVGRVS